PYTAGHGAPATGCQAGTPGTNDDSSGSYQELGPIGPVHPEPFHEALCGNGSDERAQSGGCDKDAEPQRTRSVSLSLALGKDDLGDVDTGVCQRRPAPDQEDRRQVAVLANRGAP